MKVAVFLSCLSVSLFAVGCGGGDDFDSPPSEIAERLAKAKELAQKPEAESDASSDESKPAVGADSNSNVVASPDPKVETKTESGIDIAHSAGQQSELLDGGEAETPLAPNPEVDPSTGGSVGVSDTKPSILQGIAMSSDTPNADSVVEGGSEKGDVEPGAPTSNKSTQDRGIAAAMEGERVTAGGKSVKEIEESKDRNESTAQAGMSLLDKLRVTDDADKKKPTGRTNAAREIISRTGRFAIRASTWLQLRNDLTKRFYVAATDDGQRIAASAGERSLGVLSTLVETNGEELAFTRTSNNVLAVRRDRKEITTRPVTGLPAIISSLELIQGGDVVVVGTADGRLIARSSANLQDWDIYSQDLFVWQDERRASTRIANEPIVVVRAFRDDRLLTVSESGKCEVWETGSVVHAPVDPLEVTKEDVLSNEAIVLTATSVCSLNLPQSPVLNVFFSPTGDLCGVITSDELVTVFQTADGKVLNQITAADLNDTQPVSGVFEESQMRVLLGLADGRIFRRSFGDAEPIKGQNDEGQSVDYEAVFVPDLNDDSGAITALDIKADGRLVYVGRLNGSVAQFDLPRKQLHRTDKLHQGAVIEIRSTPAGVFTIADDRLAKLSDVPNNPKVGAIETFKLPEDAVLKAKVVIEPEDVNEDKFTARRNFGGAVTDATPQDLSLVGIRPADPVLALYEHQLRVASDIERREVVRNRIEDLKKFTRPDLDRDYLEGPVQLGELETEFDFQSRPLRRVVMSISDDGMTLAASQYYAANKIRGAAPNQPVFVWDTFTKTPLRAWRKSTGVFELKLDSDSGVLLPRPFSAQMRTYTGSFLREELPSLASQKSPKDELLAIGLAGQGGAALHSIFVRKLDTQTHHSGVEAFEGAVAALAWSRDGDSLFASLRERTQARLLELNAGNLGVKAEIAVEPMDGEWDVSKVDLQQSLLGATHILPSPSGKILVTYGSYSAKDAKYQLRIWTRSRDEWPQKDVKVLPSNSSILEREFTETPIVFVDQQDASIAIVGTQGVGVVNVRSGEVEKKIDIPDVGGRRPVTLLAPNGKWLLAGDREGNVWVWSLKNLERKPQKFSAQAGPITGLAMSDNSEYLATAGEENRIRVWKVSSFLETKGTARK